MAQAGREREFALGDVKGGLSVAEKAVVQTSHVFERRVAHGGVVSVDV
jgi:hypothetical protein